MKKDLKYVIVQEGEWFIAQCLDIDIASQGNSEAQAIENLKDALTLHHTPPVATLMPRVRTIELEVAG